PGRKGALMKLGTFLSGITAVLATAATAHAGSAIVTPALVANGVNDLQCRVVNTGSQEAAGVLIEIVNATGMVVASDLAAAIPAGYTWSAVTADDQGVGYCRVTGIPKSRARV